MSVNFLFCCWVCWTELAEAMAMAGAAVVSSGLDLELPNPIQVAF